MTDLRMIGMHINNLQDSHVDAAGDLQGGTQIVLDCPPGGVARLKSKSKKTRVIVRPYMPDAHVHAWYLAANNNPREAGRMAARHCIAQRGGNPDADGWVLLNEPPCENAEQVARQAEFDIGFMEELYAHGMRACIGAFSVGNPKIFSDDGGAMLRAYAPALRRAVELDCWLIVHTYWVARPARGGGTSWGWQHDPRYFSLRWQWVIIPWLKANGIPMPKYVITEGGFDAGGAIPFGYPTDKTVGWRTERPLGYGDDEAGADAYAEDIYWYAEHYAKDPLCLGFCLYAAGDNGDMKWWSFLIDGYLLNKLRRMTFPKLATAPAGGGQQGGGTSGGGSTPPNTTPAPQITLTARLSAALGARFKDVRSSLPVNEGEDDQGNPIVFSRGDSRAFKWIVFHHTTGPKNYGPEQIARGHIAKGWAGAGYHFCICQGVLYYMGDVDTIRAHVYGRNHQSLGAVFSGTYTNVLPDAGDLEIARILVRELDAFYGHKKELTGHQVIALPGHATACPGRIMQVIPTFRQGANPYALLDHATLAKFAYWLEVAARAARLDGYAGAHDGIVNVSLPPVLSRRDGVIYIQGAYEGFALITYQKWVWWLQEIARRARDKGDLSAHNAILEVAIPPIVEAMMTPRKVAA